MVRKGGSGETGEGGEKEEGRVAWRAKYTEGKSDQGRREERKT